MSKKQKTVFVGLSGGVDSAVSAALLKKSGHKVVGVFIKTWHPDFIQCNEEEERLDAIRVAAHLDIPFLTLDLQKEYKQDVAEYMISEYKEGRTPNPDVLCNSHIKFGAFLKKALSLGADYVATGHYASKAEKLTSVQVLGSPRSPKGELRPDRSQKQIFQLIKSTDLTKDQVYFLWQLNQEQLSKIIFPVGGYTKKQVRSFAKKFKLPVSEKKDSQGICFLGDIDLKDFLKHYIDTKQGVVLDESGEIIGEHDGALFFTLGERHGFTIKKKTPHDSRYYVVAKDISKNTITVSTEPQKSQIGTRKNLILKNTNWTIEPAPGHRYTAQIRYHGEFLPCTIKGGGYPSALEVVFENPVLVAPGQSIVIYDKDVVLGGGVVV